MLQTGESKLWLCGCSAAADPGAGAKPDLCPQAKPDLPAGANLQRAAPKHQTQVPSQAQPKSLTLRKSTDRLGAPGAGGMWTHLGTV